jgi:hypothetical protein
VNHCDFKLPQKSLETFLLDRPIEQAGHLREEASMSANRMHLKETIHFITNRCEHEMFLLLPTARITEIIQCWFARALCL